MTQFKNAQESHAHSLEILDILYGYDSFLDSLEVVADFGCGKGLDSKWWATLMTRDEPPAPRNYLVYPVDHNTSILDPTVKALPNVYPLQEDIETVTLPRPADFIWCHDAFQYVTNPLGTLKRWNTQMSVNGMLLLSIPQSTHYAYNRLQTHLHSHCYYNHNIASLMYMLAVNGFDCSDAYFKKDEDDPWLYAAVYKTDIDPMDPKKTSWYDLADKGLLNATVVNCITKYGYVRQEEILATWLDKDFGKIRS